MITFEQFLKEHNPLAFDYKGYQEVLEGNPYYFTWLPPEHRKVISSEGYPVLARRVEECDSIKTPREPKIEFKGFEFSLYDSGRYEYGRLSYPVLTNDVYTPNVDFATMDLFFSFRISFSDVAALKRLSASQMRWKEYNTYQGLSGTKAEKTIKFFEYLIEDVVAEDNLITRLKDTLLRNKLKYAPRSSISKREYIRGALTDL